MGEAGELELPDQPRPGAAVHRQRPGVRLRDIAASLGITERSAYGIVTDLTAAGMPYSGSVSVASLTSHAMDAS